VQRYFDWWGNHNNTLENEFGYYSFVPMLAMIGVIFAHIVGITVVILLAASLLGGGGGESYFYENEYRCHWDTKMIGKTIYRQKECERVPTLEPVYELVGVE
jgi:hypothetical protein